MMSIKLRSAILVESKKYKDNIFQAMHLKEAFQMDDISVGRQLSFVSNGRQNN